MRFFATSKKKKQAIPVRVYPLHYLTDITIIILIIIIIIIIITIITTTLIPNSKVYVLCLRVYIHTPDRIFVAQTFFGGRIRVRNLKNALEPSQTAYFTSVFAFDRMGLSHFADPICCRLHLFIRSRPS